MSAFYKFLKHKNGITSFAAIGLELLPLSEHRVSWPSDLMMYEQLYADAVAEGINFAMQHHLSLEGKPASFLVSEFQELPVDTKFDAVRCAASVAAWKALGHEEDEVTFEFNGSWLAKLKDTNEAK